MKNNCYNCTHCIKFNGNKNRCRIYQPTLECSKFEPTLLCRLFKIDNKVIDLTDNCKRPKI